MATQPRVRFSKTAFVVVVLMVAAAVVGLRWDPGPEAPSDGDRVLAGVDSEAEPTDWTARLPYARLEVKTLVGSRTEADDVAPAGRGAQWVEVTWSIQPVPMTNGLTAWPGASAAERAEPPSTLILVVGDRRYQIADQVSSGSSGGTVTIAVTGDTDNLRVRLTSEGQQRPVQARDDLAAWVRGGEQSNLCKSPTDHGKVRFSVSCTVTASRTDYVAGLGWAPDGKDWVVVTEAGRDPGDDVIANWWPGEKSNFYPRDSGGRVDYLAAGKPSLRLTVSGADKPTATHGKPDLNAATARLELRAYQVPAGKDAKVRLTYRTRGTPDPRTDRLSGSPDQVTARAAATLDLPPFARR